MAAATVNMLAPGGLVNSTVYGQSGASYTVDASGVAAAVAFPDIGPLVAAGWTIVGGSVSGDVAAWNANQLPVSLAAAGATTGNASVVTANLTVASATASTEGVRLKAVGTGAVSKVTVPGSVGTKVYPPTGAKFSTVTSTNEAIAVAKQSTKGFIQTGAKTFALI